MCNKFVRKIRKIAENKEENSNVRLPNQWEFTSSSWCKLFKASNSRSTEDNRVYKAGLWFREHSKSVIEQTNDVFSNLASISDRSDTLPLIVGAVNLRIHEIYSGIHSAERRKNLLITEANFLSGIFEHLVDSARYPIDRASKKEKSSTRADSKDYDLLSLLQKAIDLGLSYDLLENSWNKCLWNDWWIDSNQDYDLLQPKNLKREEIYTINSLREKSLSSGSLIGEWQSLSDEDRANVLRLPRLSVGKIDNAHEMTLEVYVPSSDDPDARSTIPDLTICTFFKQDFYPKSILNKSFPNIPGLTLEKIISAWRLIATMVSSIESRFPNKSQYVQEDLLHFSPTFSCKELIGLVVESLPHIDSQQAQEILKMLTFRDHRDELWSRPLVKVGKDRMTAVYKALETPLLSRPVSRWMAEGGLKIDKKGVEFEKSVYKKLRQINKLSNMEVYPSLKKLKIDNKDEQIDLILRLGQKS